MKLFSVKNLNVQLLAKVVNFPNKFCVSTYYAVLEHAYELANTAQKQELLSELYSTLLLLQVIYI